jgi:hypothetical protein
VGGLSGGGYSIAKSVSEPVVAFVKKKMVENSELQLFSNYL